MKLLFASCLFAVLTCVSMASFTSPAASEPNPAFRNHTEHIYAAPADVAAKPDFADTRSMMAVSAKINFASTDTLNSSACPAALIVPATDRKRLNFRALAVPWCRSAR